MGLRRESMQTMIRRFDQLTASDMPGIQAVPMNDRRCLDPAVRSLYHLYGLATLLVPVDPAREHRIAMDCRELKLQDTLKPAYQQRLRDSDVGVVTGVRSNHLCCVEFRSNEAVDRLLASCPSFRRTAITRFPGGWFVWFRLADWSPRTERMENLVFHGEGDVVKIFSRDRRSRNEWGCQVPAFPPVLADWPMMQGFPEFVVGLRR